MHVMQAIETRRSVRKYRPDPIPEETLHQVTEALRLAPSACNNQPWRFIIVNDQSLRAKVAQASRGQLFMAEAPVIIVGCALPKKAYPSMGGYWNSADVDVTIALDHLTLAAAAAGLGTCWIGAFDEEAIKTLLSIPPEAKIVAMTPLGYPKQEGLLCPVGPGDRKSREEIFSNNRY